MTRKAARGLVLVWLLLGAAGQVFSGKDRLRLRPGETVRALMPEGDPVKTSVVLKLVAAEDGPLTIETHTLHFDTRLEVYEADAAGAAKPVAEDDDGGVGSNSRVGFAAAAGKRYRIEVHTTAESWGGPVEISAAAGEPPQLTAEDTRERSKAHWNEVSAEGDRAGSEILKGRAALGRGGLAAAAGDEAAARRLYDEALERFSKAAGPEHPIVAVCLAGSARTLVATGDYAAARPLLVRALGIWEKARGLEHPDTASAVSDLGQLVVRMGEYASARSLFERALAIWEKARGSEHPDTATGLANLGDTLRFMGDHAAARPLLERSVAILEKTRGPEHMDTAGALNNLALVLKGLDHPAAARPVLERVVAILEKTRGPEHLDTATALNNLGTLLRDSKDYTAARPVLERALAIWEKARGPEHPDTAVGLASLAGLLAATGDHAAARPLLERALSINEKTFGPDHKRTAAMVNSLANVLVRIREYQTARSLLERALATAEKVAGPEDLETAVALDNLGWLYGTMGEYAPARPVYERALAIREKVNGPEHPDTARALGSMAAVLRALGENAAARPILERSLAIYEKALGPEHPRTAASLNSLGDLLRSMGDYAAARPILERSLAINEKAFGPEHRDTAGSLNNLGLLLREMGEFAAARPLLERAVAISEKVFGPDHNATSTNLKNLADLLQAMGEYAAARPLYERAIAIDEKVLGPEHPRMAWGLTSLGETLRYMGEYAAARPLHERAVAIAGKALGPEHSETAVALNSLALLLREMGEYAEARPLYERALAIWEKTLGPDHPYTAASLNNLAWLLRDMGEYTEARPLLEHALAIVQKALGPEHPRMAWSLNNLGDVLLSMGEFAAARPLFERALAIDEKALGPDQPATAGGLKNLANLFQATGQYAAARPLLERALAIDEKTLGPEHSRTAWGLHSLAELLGKTGDYAAARPLYERALAINQKALGPDHPTVALNLNNVARVRAMQGEIGPALDQALEAERVGREHLQVTGRALSEREALRYAAVRRSGLDLALTLAAGGLDPAQRRKTLDALVRSRALVLDEMAARHRATGGSADPEVARLAEHLSSRRARLAKLVVRGPGDQKPEIYRKLLDDARNEKEEAERALAGSSAEFARELSRSRQGLDEVAASLPEGGALLAFSQYRKIDLRPQRPASRKPVESKPQPSYIAFVLRAGSRDPEVVDLGSAAGIDEAVSRWKKEASRGLLLSRDPRLAEAAYRQAGARLRGKVWDPLAAAIGDAARVFIVPDGSLNLVSVSALPVDDGSYLIERGPMVHYVSAERDLIPSGDRRRGEGLLALGGPSYNATELFAALRKGGASSSSAVENETIAAASATDAPVLLASAATYRGQRSACGDFTSVRFEPLPATAEETREIVRLWEEHGQEGSAGHHDSLDLRDAAANETTFKRSAAGRRVLHLATHGFFLGGGCASALASARGIGGLDQTPSPTTADSPPPATGENPLLLSGLALAGANRRSAAGEGEDDGILTAEEIASLDLSGVEWAVLSACETGVGDVRAGEGVFGLRRAFEVAGAGTLIMSLWSVDDEATRSWMKALYEGRLEEKLDTAEAVRRASLEVLNDRRAQKRSTHPFYWAAFVAAGDWR